MIDLERRYLRTILRALHGYNIYKRRGLNMTANKMWYRAVWANEILARLTA